MIIQAITKMKSVPLRERSMSTPKRYNQESNESLIRLRERLEALLSSPLVKPRNSYSTISERNYGVLFQRHWPY
ncbi:hypothetical protein H8356DRAFT_1335346 [Neocallimastix lanati (nom. inval.)]|nr:hypothetical protein H8356DRAFT_1335346 [Neocallimastix sp. JGI-2020a]